MEAATKPPETALPIARDAERDVIAFLIHAPSLATQFEQEIDVRWFWDTILADCYVSIREAASRGS
jgi:hypothetical protein